MRHSKVIVCLFEVKRSLHYNGFAVLIDLWFFLFLIAAFFLLFLRSRLLFRLFDWLSSIALFILSFLNFFL